MHGLGLAPGLIRHDPWNIKFEAITLLYSQSNYGFELAALTLRVGRGPHHVLRSMNSHLEVVLLITYHHGHGVHKHINNRSKGVYNDHIFQSLGY